ncbi:zf-TFIIB domain-containing protein [Gemmatimonas sp.]|uniref:TFIIB-type zinc ribbon-containing protein n=2 Tax=Gemmatimonas sp. TaxID=1962908 RepID=UPI0031B861E3
MRCPIDGHEMVRRDIDRRPAASCRHCHGLWISGPAIAETQLPVDHVPIESRRAGPMRPDARPCHCPQCNAVMRSERLSGLSIERCVACASVWLDAGEFDAVRMALLPNRPAPPNTRAPLRADWSAFDALTEATIALLPMFFDG